MESQSTFNFFINQSNTSTVSETALNYGGVVVSVGTTSSYGEEFVTLRVVESYVDPNSTYSDTGVEKALFTAGMLTPPFIGRGLYIIPVTQSFAQTSDINVFLKNHLQKFGHFVQII